MSALGAPLVLVLAGVFLVRVQGRWLAPGPLFVVYWAAALLLPPLLAPEFSRSAAAVWYIVAAVLAYGVGSFAACHRGPPRRPPGAQARPLRPVLLRVVVVAGTLSGFAATAIVQWVNGFPVIPDLSIDRLFHTANSISAARYADVLVQPTVVPMLLSLTYAAALLAPLAARGASRRVAVLLCAGPVLSAAYCAMITTARAVLLLAVVLLATGWIGRRIHVDGRTPRLGVRAALVGGLGAVGMTVSFLAIALLRAGGATPPYVEYVRNVFATYLFGYLPGFSYWFDHDAAALPDAWGSASLAGVTKHLGGDRSYGEALTVWAPLGPNGGITNIYTAWRHLIQDFGTVLAPVAAAVIGYLVTLAWRRLIEKPDTWSLAACMAGYAYTLFSVTWPLFIFTNVVVAFLLAAIALAASARTPRAASGPLRVRAADAGEHPRASRAVLLRNGP